VSLLLRIGVNAGTQKSMKIRLRPSTFLIYLSPLRLMLHCMDGMSPSSNVKYLGVIFDKRITWRLHIEMIEAKAFRTFIRICCLFINERLSDNNKLILHNVLIISVMTYVPPPGK
jgi:hypothetical protein